MTKTKTSNRKVAAAVAGAARCSAKPQIWQVEVDVRHYGVTMACSREEAITNCDRDGYHGKTVTLKYHTRIAPNR